MAFGATTQRCTLCRNTPSQARGDAFDADVTDYQLKIPMAQVTAIIGAPWICRSCSVKIVAAFAQGMRGQRGRQGA
jgi:hypothetical protein